LGRVGTASRHSCIELGAAPLSECKVGLDPGLGPELVLPTHNTLSPSGPQRPCDILPISI
jgi:hypothetical protein